MTKAIILMCFSLCLANKTTGQDSISLELRDGQVLKGIGKIKNNEKIVFRKTEDGEKEIYNHKEVKRVTVSEGYDKIYEYKLNGSNGNIFKKYYLMQLIMSGKVNLYKYTGSATYATPNSVSGSNYKTSSTLDYYISNQGSEATTEVKSWNVHSRSFKKLAKEFFSSCPDLMMMIEEELFKKGDLNLVVNYYNKKCN